MGYWDGGMGTEGMEGSCPRDPLSRNAGGDLEPMLGETMLCGGGLARVEIGEVADAMSRSGGLS